MGALSLILLVTPALAHPGFFENGFLRNKLGFSGQDQIAAESRHGESEGGVKYCLTPGCVKAAAGVISYMDPTVDPCTDFYEFSCGGFLKETVIPDHKTSEGAFSIIRDKLNERLRKLFESSPGVEEPEVFNSVRNLYKSCMDQEYIEKNGKEGIQRIVAELGGWPVLGDSFDEEKFVWQKLSEKANDMSLSTGKLMNIGVSTDSEDSTKRILEVDQASMGLDREYLIKGFEDKDVQAYYRYMVDTAEYLGASRDNAEKQLKEALLFEIKLAELTLPREERRNKTALNNKMRLGDLSALYPEYDWVDHAVNLMKGTQDVEITADEIINVAVPGYIKKIAAYLPTVPKKVLANFMMWRFVKGTMSFGDKEARNIQLKYSKVLTGKEQQAPRWETCVKATSGTGGGSLYFYEGSLTNAVGAMYAKKYFPADKKAVADEMVTNVKKEFKVMLDELEWMDSATRSRAHVKVDKMTPHIAYAKEILDNSLLNQFYKGLKIDSESYLDNYLALKKFINEYYIGVFREPVDNKSWKTHGGAAIVNAFYSGNENSIQFPAGILDGVFFQSDRPSYMNYGAIGMVVGHEITHGFDDQGSQKDGEGNLVNWWEKSTKQKYLKKAQCIIDQYQNYTVTVEGEELNLNGINTQGENIADNGGYKEALRAYERVTQKFGEEPVLPGLPYTQRQMFWLSGASIWCTALRPAALKQRVLTDAHSPGRFRVNGSFRNLKEFAKDWNCPVGSPMNPAQKCSVW